MEAAREYGRWDRILARWPPPRGLAHAARDPTRGDPACRDGRRPARQIDFALEALRW